MGSLMQQKSQLYFNSIRLKAGVACLCLIRDFFVAWEGDRDFFI